MLYEDIPNKRILLADGTVVVSPEEFAKKIIKKESVDGLKVISCEDVQKYHQMFLEDVMIDEYYDVCIDPPDHEHTENELTRLIDVLNMSERYQYTDVEHSRINTELEFFIRSKNIKFLLSLHKLIQKFKEDNVVWGVGRGSSCASYILYLLEIHDVNPLEYGIPFSEMSKEF